MELTDTIAAIATAPGEGSISIVRLSGPESLAIADRIMRCAPPQPSGRPSHVVVHGFITEAGRDVDEVIALIMRRPHSYTGEDSVEFQGHGGRIMAGRILRAVLAGGARMAEPGEFTKRAFLNGRMDLLQAEAVLDIVKARSDRAAIAAMEQLEGGLSRQINSAYDRLLSVTADIEASLDFPDDEIPPLAHQDLMSRLNGVLDSLRLMSGTWNEGRMLRDGIMIVITGKTNVGKSTLLNTLLDMPRAIVSPIPGTTRDILEEALVLNGIPIRLVDTAGLRDSECEIELEGIRRAKGSAEKADFQLYVLDSSVELAEDEKERLGCLEAGRCILVLNKSDLGSRIDEADLCQLPFVRTSLLNGDGVPELKNKISELFEVRGARGADPHAAISERHYQLLSQAKNEVNMAAEILTSDSDFEKTDLIATHLREAMSSIGSIVGRVYTSELLNSIFSRFCIGK